MIQSFMAFKLGWHFSSKTFQLLLSVECAYKGTGIIMIAESNTGIVTSCGSSRERKYNQD